MAVKNDKSRQHGVSKAKNETSGRIVLVGTYKGDQLTDWRGWYNYPISDEDKITDAEAAKITELWLFKGTKDERRYKAEFVGVKTRQELIDDYGYPANGKAHSDKYLLFKTLYYNVKFNLSSIRDLWYNTSKTQTRRFYAKTSYIPGDAHPRGASHAQGHDE